MFSAAKITTAPAAMAGSSSRVSLSICLARCSARDSSRRSGAFGSAGRSPAGFSCFRLGMISPPARMALSSRWRRTHRASTAVARAADGSRFAQPACALLRGPGEMRDGLGYFNILDDAALCETFRDAFAIPHLAVLAHLPLALEARDGEAKSDDAAQH